ncbi:GAF domain-containing protein [Microlunatus capsulatus]
MRTRPSPAPSPGGDPGALADRFRDLLGRIREMGRETTVAGRLRRMVELSVGLTRAQYAAFAVRAPDGGVERYVLSSADTEEVATIQLRLTLHGVDGSAHLRGLAARTASRPEPAAGRRRLPRSPVLEVPLQTRFGLYGTLYVFGSSGAEPFTADDRELLDHLVETTALGVDNASHLEEARQRQHWLMASAEVSRLLLGGDGDERAVWREIAANVKYLAGARTVTISRPSEDDPDELEVQVASGVGAEALEGRRYARAGSLADLAISTGEVQLVTVGDRRGVHSDVEPSIGVGPLLALPLKGRGEVHGAVVVSRPLGEPAFAAADVSMAEDFATQAALALELAETRSARQLLEDRDEHDRIPDTLQDQVIQRLFSIGLSLQSTAGEVLGAAARPRLFRAITDIDDTIQQVRASVDPRRRGERSAAMTLLRTTVLGLVDELEPDLGFRPEVVFAGTLDTVVDAGASTVVERVLRTALQDAVRPAGAHRGRVEVSGGGDGLTLLVADDGAGLAERGTAVARLWEQAADDGQIFTVERPADGGLRLRWLLPQG